MGTVTEMYARIGFALSAKKSLTCYKSTLGNLTMKVINVTGNMEEFAHDYLNNCCSLEVNKRINESYESLHSDFKGGATYLYYMLKTFLLSTTILGQTLRRTFQK